MGPTTHAIWYAGYTNILNSINHKKQWRPKVVTGKHTHLGKASAHSRVQGKGAVGSSQHQQLSLGGLHAFHLGQNLCLHSSAGLVLTFILGGAQGIYLRTHAQTHITTTA